MSVLMTSEVLRADLVADLLPILAAGSRSDFAIFRTIDPTSGALVLSDFACNPWFLPRSKESFAVPQQKIASCWSTDPRNTWGAVSIDAEHSHSTLDGEFTEDEAEFVQAVREKAWFPVCFGEDQVGVIVLIRTVHNTEHPLPYRYREVLEAWSRSQSLISCSYNLPIHRGFENATSALQTVRKLHSDEEALMALAHCFVSSQGLGWNRFWLFEELPGEQTWKCLIALGEFNSKRWNSAMIGMEGRRLKLDSEIAHALTEETDRNDLLRQICTTPPGLAIEAWACGERWGDLGTPTVMPVAIQLDDERRKSFDESVADTAPELEYSASTELFSLPLTMNGQRHVAIFGDAYAVGDHSPLLTTSFAHFAALAMGERKAERRCDPEQLEKDVENAVRGMRTDR